MDKKLKGLEFAGAVFVFVCGTLLHFLYEWSNKNVVGILFGAVNESVWEHIKIFALPYLVWGVIELAFSIGYFRQFVVAKVFGLYLQCILIISFYYLYSSIIGCSILWLDILSVLVWICLAQLFSFKLTTGQRDVRVLFPFVLGLLFLFGAMYFCFTAVPPHIDLFKDPVTGMYGIIPKNIDVGAFFMGTQEI